MNRNLLWLLGLVACAALAYYFSDILTYILLAWVLSMLGRPLTTWFRTKIRLGKWRLGASGAAVLTIVSVYLLGLGLIMLFVPTIVEQTRNLTGVDYQALGEKLKVPFADLDMRLHRYGLLSAGESLGTRTQEVLSSVFKPTLLSDFVGAFIATAGNILVTITAVTFILFFFLQDNTLFPTIVHALVPERLEKKVVHAIDDSSDMLTRYFAGLVIQIASFSAIFTLLLWIMGIENALLIGAFGGLINVVPYVGPIIAMIFGSFITVSSHLDTDFSQLWPMLVKVLGAAAVTQFLDNNFVGPAIFSKSVKAHPLEIFIVTLVAAKLGGVLGMVMGIPVYTVLRVIARVFFSEFKFVQLLTEPREEEPAQEEVPTQA